MHKPFLIARLAFAFEIANATAKTLPTCFRPESPEPKSNVAL
ncbi:hypothetical protein V1292_004388 [Bradyrhizobium sp. AZCC 1719]